MPVKPRVYGYDVETVGLDPFVHKSGIIVESYQQASTTGYGRTRKCVVPMQGSNVAAILGGPAYSLVGHNMWTFDALWISGAMLDCAEEVHDTLAMAALLAEPGESVGLDEVALRYLDEQKDDVDLMQLLDDIQDGSLDMDYRLACLEALANYCKKDAVLAAKLFPVLQKELQSQKLWEVYTMWREFSVSLIAMMRRGVGVSSYWRTRMTDKAEQDIQAALKKFYTASGLNEEEFNLNSGPQLSEFLYETLSLPVYKRTDSGKPSVDKATLNKLKRKVSEVEEFAAIHTVLESILEYRNSAKFKGTFLDRLDPEHPKTYVGYDGNVHTTYRLVYDGRAGARTGRLSSSGPNMQNLPGSKGIKKLFIDPKKSVIDPPTRWVSADYSQIELRVVATMAQEQKMLAAFKAGEDIHSDTAARVFGYDSVEKFMQLHGSGDEDALRHRKLSKTLNFGILYGMGAMSLAENLTAQGVETSTSSAAEMIRGYDTAYPAIYVWRENTRLKAAENGIIHSLFGFPRKWRDGLSSAAGRQAVNTPVQSTAAWICLQALSWMHEEQVVTPLVTVHDEIAGVYDMEDWTPEGIKVYVKRLMVTQMEDYLEKAWNFPIPLAVDIRAGGLTWQEGD